MSFKLIGWQMLALNSMFWMRLVVIIIIMMVMIRLWEYFSLWFQGYMSGADVTFLDVVGMKHRKVDTRAVILSKILVVKTGLKITTKELEAHDLAGGQIWDVVSALVAAQRAGMDLDFQTACEMDLAGNNPLEAVHQSAACMNTDDFNEQDGGWPTSSEVGSTFD